MIKVLFVDDESKVREAIRCQIPWNELGLYLIGTCANAIEALHQMTEEMPDILITDVKMPIMNGIELIGKAKAMYPLLQCIIVSGYDEFSLAQAAMMEGVRHYLLKPCVKEDVVEVLKKCCEEIRKIKEETLGHCDSRDAIVEKLVCDLKNISIEDGAIENQIRQLMIFYGEDRSLLKEALTIFVVKYWSKEDTSGAMKMMEKLLGCKDSIYDFAAEILFERERFISADGSFVGQIKKYVDKNYAQDNLSLQYIADSVVNMDAKHIGKKFHQKMGIKFSDYLLKVRMEQAINMLSSKKEHKMYEIAENVGLGNNIKYFYQLFKKYTGMTPKEYQENISAN